MYPPPQPPPYGQPPVPYPARPSRPAGPRVLGIIGIIFAAIGFVSSLVFTLGPLSDVTRWKARNAINQARGGIDYGPGSVDGITNWLYLWGLLSFVLFALHLAGSIMAIMYKRGAPKILTAYGVGAIVLIVIDLVMVHGFVPRTGFDLYGSITISHSVFSGIAVVWPVVVLALINTRKAREACCG